MCLKKLSKAYYTLKLELRIMHLRKFGEMNHMTLKVTFGPLVVLYLNSLINNLLFKEKTCQIYMNQCKGEELHH